MTVLYNLLAMLRDKGIVTKLSRIQLFDKWLNKGYDIPDICTAVTDECRFLTYLVQAKRHESLLGQDEFGAFDYR